MKRLALLVLLLSLAACSHAPPRVPMPHGPRVPINAPAASSSSAAPASYLHHQGD